MFAILIATSLVVVLLVENRRLSILDEERAAAVEQISKLESVASAADQAADRLEEYLVARHGGYDSLVPRLRGMQSGLRNGRRNLPRYRAVMTDPEDEITSQSSRMLAHLAALFEFNSGGMDKRVNDEPTLEFAELSHGSFQARATIDELTLRNLARYLWLISMNVEGLAAVDVNETGAQKQLVAAYEDAVRPVGIMARQQAAILWQHMLAVARAPSSYGLETDANGQVSLGQIKARFVSLRADARLPNLLAVEGDGAETSGDRLKSLQDVSVSAPGLGFSVPMDISIKVAPFLVSGALIMMAALFAASSKLVKKIGYGSEVRLPLPFLLHRELIWDEAFAVALAQIILTGAPLGLLLFTGYQIEIWNQWMFLPIISTVILWMTMVGLRRTLRDHAAPFVH